MTHQEAFDKVYTHFVIEGHAQCTDDAGRCVYENAQGERCAIGLLLPPHLLKLTWQNGKPDQYGGFNVIITFHYRPGSHYYPIYQWVIRNGLMPDFLHQLQQAHDGAWSPRALEEKLRALAHKWNLTIPIHPIHQRLEYDAAHIYG